MQRARPSLTSRLIAYPIAFLLPVLLVSLAAVRAQSSHTLKLDSTRISLAAASSSAFQTDQDWRSQDAKALADKLAAEAQAVADAQAAAEAQAVADAQAAADAEAAAQAAASAPRHNHESTSPRLGGSTGGGSTPSGCSAPGPTPPDYVKQRESGGNYGDQDSGGNGHYGAWQFSPETWQGVGGTGNPANASPAEQDCRAATLWNNGAGASNWAETV